MSTNSETPASPAMGLAISLAAVSVSALVSIGIALFLNWGR